MGVGGHQILGAVNFLYTLGPNYLLFFRTFARVKRISAQSEGLQPLTPHPTPLVSITFL